MARKVPVAAACVVALSTELAPDRVTGSSDAAIRDLAGSWRLFDVCGPGRSPHPIARQDAVLGGHGGRGASTQVENALEPMPLR